MCQRGDVYYVELPKRDGTSIQYGIRPFVITQNNIGNKFSPVVFGYAITSKVKNPLPTHVYLTEEDGLFMDSHVMCEQPFTIAKKDLKEKICTLSEEKMEEIDMAVLISHGIKLERLIESNDELLQKIIKKYIIKNLNNRLLAKKLINDNYNKYIKELICV